LLTTPGDTRNGVRGRPFGQLGVQFARNKKHPSSLHKFARTTGCKARRAPKYLRVQDRAGNFSRWRPVR
jgi:hypothetical protein